MVSFGGGLGCHQGTEENLGGEVSDMETSLLFRESKRTLECSYIDGKEKMMQLQKSFVRPAFGPLEVQ